MNIPLIAGLGPQELIIIAIVLVLLFGAKKLPELARGTGQALRIFKAETKALQDDEKKPVEGGQGTTAQSTAQPTAQPTAQSTTQPTTGPTTAPGATCGS